MACLDVTVEGSLRFSVEVHAFSLPVLKMSWEYYSPQYRLRLYPPCGYSILYEEHHLTWFNHQEQRYSNALVYHLTPRLQEA